METDPKPRPLTHAERGAIGARKRWGPPRVVRMDTLTPEERAVVEALLELKRSREAR